MNKILVEVNDLRKTFNPGKRSEVHAVNDVSFNIYEGETFGLVGESGSGKSTTGRIMMKLESISGGEIKYDGVDIEDIKSGKDLMNFRKDVQMIFQDPYASLNPRLTVGDTLSGVLSVHKIGKNHKERTARVYQLLEQVGLNATFYNRYPKEMSGGQCQRVGIARALAVQPKFIIADEAISALDVSIQAQVVNLLIDLKKNENFTYLFIAHDLSMVRFISDRIGVMNSGRMLEIAPADELYKAPLHPYTESLLSAIPVADPEEERRRQRIDYDPSHHTYPDTDDTVAMHEIAPGHWVYCSASQVADLQRKHQSLMA